MSSAVPGTVSVSLVSLLVLIGGKMLNERFKNKLPVAVPWELILVCDTHANTLSGLMHTDGQMLQ